MAFSILRFSLMVKDHSDCIFSNSLIAALFFATWVKKSPLCFRKLNHYVKWVYNLAALFASYFTSPIINLKTEMAAGRKVHAMTGAFVIFIFKVGLNRQIEI